MALPANAPERNYLSIPLQTGLDYGANHVGVGDLDGDGKDEIINGSIAIDHDGTQRWITGEGHGDRLHMTDIDPDRTGLEIWHVQEGGANYGTHLRNHGLHAGHAAELLCRFRDGEAAAPLGVSPRQPLATYGLRAADAIANVGVS